VLTIPGAKDEAEAVKIAKRNAVGVLAWLRHRRFASKGARRGRHKQIRAGNGNLQGRPER